MKSHGFCSLQLVYCQVSFPSIRVLLPSPLQTSHGFPWLQTAILCCSHINPSLREKYLDSLFQVNKGKGVNTLGDPWMTLKSKLLT